MRSSESRKPGELRGSRRKRGGQFSLTERQVWAIGEMEEMGIYPEPIGQRALARIFGVSRMTIHNALVRERARRALDTARQEGVGMTNDKGRSEERPFRDPSGAA